MNKVTLIALSCFLGLSLGTTVGIAQAETTHVEQAHGVRLELPAVEKVETPVPTVQGHHAVTGGQHRQAAKKVWTCGQMQELATGGMARTCEWK